VNKKVRAIWYKKTLNTHGSFGRRGDTVGGAGAGHSNVVTMGVHFYKIFVQSTMIPQIKAERQSSDCTGGGRVF